MTKMTKIGVEMTEVDLDEMMWNITNIGAQIKDVSTVLKVLSERLEDDESGGDENEVAVCGISVVNAALTNVGLQIEEILNEMSGFKIVIPNHEEPDICPASEVRLMTKDKDDESGAS